MGLLKTAFMRKDGDDYHEGDFYVHCSFGRAVTYAKKLEKIPLALSVFSTTVVEVDEQPNTYMSKTRLNKENYRTIIINDEPENNRCHIEVIIEYKQLQKSKDHFETVKDWMERRCKSEIRQQTASSGFNNNMSTADEIKKYKELLDEGIITQEEFVIKKNELLNSSNYSNSSQLKKAVFVDNSNNTEKHNTINANVLEIEDKEIYNKIEGYKKLNKLDLAIDIIETEIVNDQNDWYLWKLLTDNLYERDGLANENVENSFLNMFDLLDFEKQITLINSFDYSYLSNVYYDYWYNKGIECVNNEDYVNAKKYLQACGEYNDSKEILNKIDDYENANTYNSAIELFNQEDYLAALEIFNLIKAKSRDLNQYEGIDDYIIATKEQIYNHNFEFIDSLDYSKKKS